jgi:hypothetical protein
MSRRLSDTALGSERPWSVPRWTDLKLPCASAIGSKVTAERGTSLKFAESHSSTAFRSAWFGVSALLGSCAPVFGLESFVASQRSMVVRS